jgi:asparagine synthase (glutamine-hydrolysing)
MCGIFGILSAGERPDEATSAACVALLAHRGPDGDGLWHSAGGAAPHVTLGHRRLAIIDLSDAAAQPMRSDDGALSITYNGEIYNYVELMAELEAKGHRFRSRSDTEVILRAYEEWGPECLGRFNGMFAFAIWNARRRELFAARDRFGEKPFHYAWDPRGRAFAFASEIKALVAVPGVDASLDERALYRYVAFQELAGAEQTLWRGVRRLPHAHYLRLAWRGDGFDLAVRRYWDVDLERVETPSLDDAARRFAELFEDSVRIRLRSDVPVGSSLSGGLDSSGVVCQIHALGAAGGQKAFSARMDDPRYDEGSHIATVLARTGVEGHEVWPSADELTAEFSRLCYHLEEPFPATSQFAQYLVMRLASRERVTVLLDGQGADELLAGYRPYFRAAYSELADRWRLARLWRERAAWRAKHGRAFPLSPKEIAARLAPGLYRFVRAGAALTPPRPETTSWWDPDWLSGFDLEQPRAARHSSRDRLTRRLYEDAFGGELQELLRYGDRNSMAWSREVRQPFLDHRLAELLFALPLDFKLSGGETKVLLRRAMRGLVPDPILARQDKIGYQAPMRSWLGGGLAAWAETLLEQATAQLGTYLAPGAVDRFRREARSLGDAEAKTVFSIITMGETMRQLQAVPRGVEV